MTVSLPSAGKQFMSMLIGAASVWGGNPDKDALYLNITPSKNHGTTIYKLKVKDVPVDGFWSITE